MEPISEYSLHSIILPVKIINVTQLFWHSDDRQATTSNVGIIESHVVLDLGCRGYNPFVSSQELLGLSSVCSRIIVKQHNTMTKQVLFFILSVWHDFFLRSHNKKLYLLLNPVKKSTSLTFPKNNVHDLLGRQCLLVPDMVCLDSTDCYFDFSVMWDTHVLTPMMM